MAYTPTNFVNDVTAWNADEANKVQTGIDQVHNFMDKFSGNQNLDTTDSFALMAQQSSGLYVPRYLLSTDMPNYVREATSSTAYTAVFGDFGKLKELTAATAVTFTVPTGLGGRADSYIMWRQYGAGVITFTAGAGMVLTSRGSAFKSAGAGAEGQLTRRGTSEEFIVSGDLVV